ncbi:unnamed protein product [Moneuplotes crassus]|uniref:Uncharacterized protein n=1 Tax=Euplotes crassus TaxID=5936 RepID=A0AAD2D679_EUPCR|nr:unnamed protein product [Moneuplotes crassus]
MVKYPLQFHPAFIFLLRVVNVLLMLAHAYMALILLAMAQDEDLMRISFALIGAIFLPSLLYQVSSGLRTNYLFNLFAHGLSSLIIFIAIILAVILNGFSDTELGNFAGIFLIIAFGPGALISITLLLLLNLDQPKPRNFYFNSQDGQMYQTMMPV